MTIREKIYLLPGRGGHLHSGLGGELASRGLDVMGRELHGEFGKMRFSEQVGAVAEDLRTIFWHKGARVIANSFGAYLFLHAQASLPPYVGRVLLLCPVVGDAINEETMMVYVPPAAGRLEKLIADGAFHAPLHCQVHVGELDWQASPKRVTALLTPLGISVATAPGAGHILDKSYVARLLDAWLEM